ncbi:MAG: hypothetical protein WD971_00555 [Pirellulales bacterium]
MFANFDANVDGAPRFQIDEPSAPRGSFDAVLRLTRLLSVAGILLLTTIALRSWTAANDAKLPPIEYAKQNRQPTVPPSWHEERKHFMFPSPPRI